MRIDGATSRAIISWWKLTFFSIFFKLTSKFTAVENKAIHPLWQSIQARLHERGRILSTHIYFAYLSIYLFGVSFKLEFIRSNIHIYTRHVLRQCGHRGQTLLAKHSSHEGARISQTWIWHIIKHKCIQNPTHERDLFLVYSNNSHASQWTSWMCRWLLRITHDDAR